MATQSILARAARWALLLCGALAPASRAAGLPPDLKPGFGTVQYREKDRFRILLDRDAGIVPADLAGKLVVVRRQLKQVRLPQSYTALAEHWDEAGMARVLPLHLTNGALSAEVLAEDPQKPITSSTVHRIEFCRVASTDARPVVLAVQCLTPRGVADATQGATVVAGECVAIEATVFCPSARAATCTWSAEVGQFVHADGTPAGKTVTGPALVRWNAPAVLDGDGAARKVTIRLQVSGGVSGAATTTDVPLELADPATYGATPQTLAPTPPFKTASAVASGPLGSAYILDASTPRLVQRLGAASQVFALPASPLPMLRTHEGACYTIHDGRLGRYVAGAKAAESVAALSGTTRASDFGINGVGDAYVLDGSAMPRLRLFARDAAGKYGEVALEPRIGSQGTTRFCIDPLSNDAYVYDSQEHVLRHWRPVSVGRYALHGAPIPLSPATGRDGPVVAVVLRSCGGQGASLPVSLLFQKGAVAASWTRADDGGAWQPEVAVVAAPLRAMGFAAREACALVDGDLLVAGSRKTADGNGDLVVQLSPEGALRRRLPRPSEPVQHVAAAIDGTRTLLLGPRATEAIHLIGVGPDGWLLRDAGTLKSMQKVLACRADRASAEHVLVVAELRRRQSAFRVKLGTSLLPMELSSAGLPGRSIPSHAAVDVASSATHLAVLAEDGKVLLFSTGSFPRYVGAFETSLRSPKAIAVLSDVVRRSVAGSRARSYVCVLSGGAIPAIHLWEVRAPAGGPVVATPLGSFPDAKRHPEAAQLSSPLAMESAFPDRPEMLFVLDGGGTRVRAYNVAEIAAKLSQQGLPDLAAEPVLKALPPTSSGAGFAVAPGRALHIADRQTGTLRTYTRCP